MIFDGSSALVGDTVYDIVFGIGTVDNVIEDERRISVDFGNRSIAYDLAGVGPFQMKTLFWHDPVGGFLPMKDENRWVHFCELRKALAQIVLSSTHIKENK